MSDEQLNEGNQPSSETRTEEDNSQTNKNPDLRLLDANVQHSMEPTVKDDSIVAQTSDEVRDNQKQGKTDQPKRSLDISSSEKDNKQFEVTDTYDVITGSEIQDLTGWESIHRGSLSEIPPIDHAALKDLESRAKDVAGNLDHLLGTLAASLKSLSVTSVQSVDTYKTSIQNVEDTVDLSIKNMYKLIAKSEELNSHMGPLYTIAAQIKDIKRTLDVFESVCK